MTTDEKRQQKAALLLEHEETRQELAHIRAKAWALSQGIKETADWLADAREMLGPASDSSARERDEKIRDGMNSYRAMFDFAAIVALREELKVTNAKLRELAEQKKALGLGV
jgi:hypothetical protein